MNVTNVRRSLKINKVLRRPVVLLGRPGAAKTQNLAQFAKNERAGHLLVKVSQVSELEFKGLPDYEKRPELKEELGVERVSVFVPGMFVDRAWQLQRQFGSVHITFDEAGNARGPVQVALYEALESASLGGYPFPPNTFIAATSNRMEDQSGTFKLVPPLVNRGWIMEQEVGVEEWIQHFMDPEMGYKMPLYPGMSAWHRFTRGEKLHTFDPKRYVKEYPFGSPRSYHAASDACWVILGEDGAPDPYFIEFLSGLIGRGEASEYCGFLNTYQELPTKAEVLKNPETAKVPSKDKPGALYAVASAVVVWADPAYNEGVGNFDQLMAYIERLPKTFQFMATDDIGKRYPEFFTSRVYTKWTVKNIHHRI